ncbi:DUF4304 domain-containing protein [Solicola sp. PLA-1-18]|uniref:DUF4304 domain-containing protein n=1 Tax=Solicola sp. PLA-1-18 TaxID=3380532 RepID=UPI003B765310
MTLKDALREGVKAELAPMLRGHGFRGTLPTWRLRNDAGDWAIVNLQSSQWNSADGLTLVLNIAVAPAAWLRWLKDPGRAASRPTASDGVYQERLYPTGAADDDDVWWSVTSEGGAVAAVRDMTERLRVEGVPRLVRLLDHAELVAELREQGHHPDGYVGGWLRSLD